MGTKLETGKKIEDGRYKFSADIEAARMRDDLPHPTKLIDFARDEAAGRIPKPSIPRALAIREEYHHLMFDAPGG